MKTTLTALSLLACSVSGVVPCRAQDNGFPDVPKDHWAYQAVTDLKRRGILKGYPAEPATSPAHPAPRQRDKPRGTRRSRRSHMPIAPHP